MRLFIGCDVSKKKFDAALLLEGGKYRSKVFDNDSGGFEAFVGWLTQQLVGEAVAHVCMESTGVYHEALATNLHDRGLKVSIVNPLRVKRFIESEGVRSKTDDGDAKALARFCAKNTPEPWEAPSRAVRELQALIVRLDTLAGMRQAEENRQELAHESVRASIDRVIETLDESIRELKEKIRSTIDDDPDLKDRRELLETIPGLGDRTIPQLLAYIGRPERFHSAKALIAYASLAPMIRQSGTSLNKNKGTHPQGNRDLKTALYFPAMVAGRYNPIIKAFWERLKSQGKPGRVIVVACMHKLLAIAYGVLKSKKPFDPLYTATRGT